MPKQTPDYRFARVYYARWTGLFLLLAGCGLILAGNDLFGFLAGTAGFLLTLVKLAYLPPNHYYILTTMGMRPGYLGSKEGRWYLLPAFWHLRVHPPYWVNRQLELDLSRLDVNHEQDYSYQLKGQLLLRYDPTRITSREIALDMASEQYLQSTLLSQAGVLVHRAVEKFLRTIEPDAVLSDARTQTRLAACIRQAFIHKDHPEANKYGLVYVNHRNVALSNVEDIQNWLAEASSQEDLTLTDIPGVHTESHRAREAEKRLSVPPSLSDAAIEKSSNRDDSST